VGLLRHAFNMAIHLRESTPLCLFRLRRFPPSSACSRGG
jgi:hypothetical protein